MLIDEAEIILKGGHGGPGKVSFFPGFKSGPDGGNGGRGGNLYLEAVSDLFALNQFSREKEIGAENGQAGESNRRSGREGRDLVVKVPVGSVFTDQESGEEITPEKVGDVVLVSKGGLGGKGNWELKSPRRTTPKFAQPGLPGEERRFKVVLKLIALYGLIGLPNAGKSSLLNELTKAGAKVGDYPFTTLEPNLGSFNGKIIADIPGLIEGASEGKGLGIRFLKHIEKVELLLHCIAADSPDPKKDYHVVAGEMKEYNPEFLNKKQIILLTKADLADKDELEKKMTALKTLKKKILPVSVYDWDSLEILRKNLVKV